MPKNIASGKKNNYQKVRNAKFAGQFYKKDVQELKQQICDYLSEKNESPKAEHSDERLAGLMVPHAGYIFSGRVAASGYALLSGRLVDTVVIMSSAHAAPYDGVAVDTHDIWQTPLGSVDVNDGLAKQIADAHPAIRLDANPHIMDHTIEVQLPFLQSVIPNSFRIVPILFGVDNQKRVVSILARELARLLGPEDLVIASSDMSHYPDYEEANAIDRETLDVISNGSGIELDSYLRKVERRLIPNEHTALCSEEAVTCLLELSKTVGWQRIEKLDYSNSGDSPAGEKESVVGYGAVAFWGKKTAEDKRQEHKQCLETESMLTLKQKEFLLEVARESVEAYVTEGVVPEFDVNDPALKETRGAFVTLRINGELRGCIGQIAPSDKYLWQVIRDQAIAAAVDDPRFPPVDAGELSRLECEVSVLSPPRRTQWQKVKPGRDGVIVKQGSRAGVFLPQVAAEAGWERDELLANLCAQKAGLPPDCYQDEDTDLLIFTADVFSDVEYGKISDQN
jgi:hypothetical protein